MRRARESERSLAERRYCSPACVALRGGRYKWTDKSPRATPEIVDARRIPQRVRALLLSAVQEHPYLLRAFARVAKGEP
ncbi:MAG: hypothetical protein H0U69_03585 [Trueperaceae bacterium]|nr:hypothetical protein [Trueperaceae bacterium]